MQIKVPVIEEHLPVVGNWGKGLSLCVNKHKIIQMSVLFHFPACGIMNMFIWCEKDAYAEAASLLLNMSKKPA